MPGQFARPRDEQGRFISARDFIAAGEAGSPGALTADDEAFVARFRASDGMQEPSPETTAELDPAIAPEPTAGEEKAAPLAAGAAATAETAAVGGGLKSAAGKLLPGAAVAVLAQKAATTLSKDDVIGTLEGGSATSKDELAGTMRELLGVQQTIERLGTPIRDEVKTEATDSRW